LSFHKVEFFLIDSSIRVESNDLPDELHDLISFHLELSILLIQVEDLLDIRLIEFLSVDEASVLDNHRNVEVLISEQTEYISNLLLNSVLVFVSEVLLLILLQTIKDPTCLFCQLF
jgi:hypothetical protein